MRSKRILSLVLSVAMLISQIGVTIFAKAVGGEIIQCEHHSEHTPECSYSEGVSCSHHHDVEKCGYAEATAAIDCNHNHDDTCGFVEGKYCTFTTSDCELCSQTDSDTGELQEKCSCEVSCTDVEQNVDCPVCTSDFTACKNEEQAPSIGVSSITITEFDKLDTTVQERSVDAGTALEGLAYPPLLSAIQ